MLYREAVYKTTTSCKTIYSHICFSSFFINISKL